MKYEQYTEEDRENLGRGVGYTESLPWGKDSWDINLGWILLPTKQLCVFFVQVFLINIFI